MGDIQENPIPTDDVQPTPPVESETPAPAEQDDLPEGVDALGDPGKRALDSMKEQRNAARDQVRDLTAQLEQAQQAGTTTQEQLQTLGEQLEKANTDAARYKVAARFGVSTEPNKAEDGSESPSDAEMFLTGSTEEELVRQAQRLASIRKASLDDALVDPTQGGGGRPAPVEPEPGTSRLAAALDAQINK